MLWSAEETRSFALDCIKLGLVTVLLYAIGRLLWQWRYYRRRTAEIKREARNRRVARGLECCRRVEI